jgi:hypothetical protein
MSKRFLVASGYLARVGGYWYDHRVTLIIVEDERVDVFRRAAAGERRSPIGSHRYEDLDPASPPQGLTRFQWDEGMSLPLTIVSEKGD